MEQRDRENKKPLTKAIKWARSLTDHEIATILGAELMRAGAVKPKDPYIQIQYELAHEMKFRFEYFDRIPQREYDDGREEED